MQEKKLGHFDVSEDNTSLVMWGWGMKYNTNAPISDQVPPSSSWRLFIWFFSVCLQGSVLAFHEHGLQGRSLHSGKVSLLIAFVKLIPSRIEILLFKFPGEQIIASITINLNQLRHHHRHSFFSFLGNCPPTPPPDLSLRAKWWLRGGVGGQFPRDLNWFKIVGNLPGFAWLLLFVNDDIFLPGKRGNERS